MATIAKLVTELTLDDQMSGELQKATKQTERSMQAAKKAGQDLAIGIGALTGAFALAARSQVTAERQTALLTRQYGDQADSLRDLSEEIQRTTQFSNDQAVQAINTFATLQRNYDLTTEQIVQLTRVTADLAAATGFDLADAALRVQSAIRGEGEAAEALGLTMNQQSIDRENLTLTMSNQEAGQFRLNALLEQTAFAEGAAAERAATAAGSFQQMANRVQDAAQDVAEWSGVTGEAVAVASDFTLQIALMGGGLVKLGSGLKGLAGAAGVGGLITALGPVGLVAAAGLGAVALFKIVDAIDSDYRPAMDDAAEATDTLRGSIEKLLAAGDPTALMADPWVATMDAINVSIGSTLDQLHKVELDIAAIGGTPMGAGLNNQLEDLNHLFDIWGLSTKTARQEVEETNEALNELVFATGPGVSAALADVDKAFQQLSRGEIDLATFLNRVQEINAALPDYNRLAIEAGDSTRSFAASAEHATQSIGVLFTGTKHLSDRLKDYTEGAERATLATRDLALVSEATEITATVIPAPIIATPDPMAITFFTDLERAYANIGRGALMASEALLVFKDTQDGLLDSQQVYNDQLGEYNSQLSAVEAGLALVQEKQAAGIALSAEEQAILDGSGAAIERLTGGVEDAITARALLAIQYAENMRVGDQLNENLKGQQAITGQLVEIVKLLILSLDGIPEDVKTQVSLIGADDAISKAASLANTLAGIPSFIRSEIALGLSTGGLPVGGLFPAFAHGGLFRGPGAFMAGERGPEIVLAGGDARVFDTAATRAMVSAPSMGGPAGGRGFTNHGTINVYANDPEEFHDKLRAWTLGAGGR